MGTLRNARPRFVRRPKKPRPPLNAQVEYLRALRQITGYAEQLVVDRLFSRLPGLLAQAVPRFNADASDPGRRINRVLDGISEAFFRRYDHDRLTRIARNTAAQVSEHNKGQLLKQLQQSIGIDLGDIAAQGLKPVIQTFTAENVALIKTLPQNMFDRIERQTLAAVRTGQRAADLEKAIRSETFGATKTQTMRIARDQINKLNGDLNRVRQQQIGVEKYIWRTSGDERVREEHAERDGEIFSWSEPAGDPNDPGDGAFPGDAIQCRCWAEPVLSDLFDTSAFD